MNKTASTLLRQSHDALAFANDVRSYLNLPLLDELPEPQEYYSAFSCPLAIAFGGDGAGINVEVTGKNLTTTQHLAADALLYIGGGSATYSYGTYTIKAPALVEEFVKLFDNVWELEQRVAKQSLQLAQIATQTGYAHDSAYNLVDAAADADIPF